MNCECGGVLSEIPGSFVESCNRVLYKCNTCGKYQVSEEKDDNTNNSNPQDAKEKRKQRRKEAKKREKTLSKM